MSVSVLVPCLLLCPVETPFLCVQLHVLLVQLLSTPVWLLLALRPLFLVQPHLSSRSLRRNILLFNMLLRLSTKFHSLRLPAQDQIPRHRRNSTSLKLVPHHLTRISNSSNRLWLPLRQRSTRHLLNASRASVLLKQTSMSKSRILKLFLCPAKKLVLVLSLAQGNALSAKVNSRMAKLLQSSTQSVHLRILQRNIATSTRLAKVLLVVSSLPMKLVQTSVSLSSK